MIGRYASIVKGKVVALWRWLPPGRRLSTSGTVEHAEQDAQEKEAQEQQREPEVVSHGLPAL
jgi:hypothetical protein